ncbi:MAG: glycosyltransferase family 4 protein [Chloroflexota bacterium]
MNKRRILYVITRPDIGGAQGNVFDLISRVRNQYDVSLAVGFYGSLTDSVAKLGIDVHILPSLVRSINPITDVKAVREFLQLLDSIKPDLVHLHSSKAGTIGRIGCRIARIPSVYTAHGWGFSLGNPVIRRRIAYCSEALLGRLGQIICVSEDDRQQAIHNRVSNPSNIKTIRYGIDALNCQVAQPNVSPPTLVMVARFSEQKDQATLLRAIALLSHLNFCVQFVGSGPYLDDMIKLAEQLDVTEKVDFLGDRNDVPQILSESQVFVLSTNYEGLPISILEAMRAGLPVVGSKVNGIPEEVVDGVTGYIVPPHNAEDLAIALRKLIENPELRSQMGTAGKEKFHSEFEIRRMLTETTSLYEDVMDHHSFINTKDTRMPTMVQNSPKY